MRFIKLMIFLTMADNNSHFKETISVIIPLYCAETYIAEALGSVFRQTLMPEEVIVIDDASTDSSVAMLGRFISRIRFFQHNINQGSAAARNTGLSHAKGDFIAFLDADDVWTDNHLQTLMEPFLDNQEIDIVFGKEEVFLSPEINVIDSINLDKFGKSEFGYLPTSCIIRRKVFEKIGDLNPALKLGEFIDWFSRAKDSGIKYVTVPELVAKRRIHKNNQGIRNKEFQKDYLKVLRSSLHRKRES